MALLTVFVESMSKEALLWNIIKIVEENCWLFKQLVYSFVVVVAEMWAVFRLNPSGELNETNKGKWLQSGIYILPKQEKNIATENIINVIFNQTILVAL